MLSNGEESANEVDDQDLNPVQKKAKRPKKDAKGKKAGIVNNELEIANPNMIKVKNKLVGSVEQGDLYASDDGLIENLRDAHESVEIKDEKLDLGTLQQAPKMSTNSFLAKIKKGAPNENNASTQIQQLGFLQAATVNELAARGFQLSIRDTLVKKSSVKVLLPLEDKEKNATE